MREIIKKIIKGTYSKIMKFRLWYRLVIKEHRNYKLSFYHKFRAIKYGFSSDFYHMYHLEKNNPKDYISEYKRVLSRNINEQYKIVFDNKLIFEKIFKNYLNTPKNIITVLDKLYDENGNVITSERLNEVLSDNKYIFKPAAGSGGGIGVGLIKKVDENYLFNNKTYSFSKLYNELLKYRGFVINEYICQHDYSSKINPNSVNTIRIITIRDVSTDEVIIPCAVHRFGSKKSGIVDNVSSGGYVTEINIEKGILGRTAYGIDVKFTDFHPDTKVKINGTKIPHWKDITSCILKVSKKFPYIPFIAWDVVVTENGFSVIEINASSSLELFQVFGSIKETKLGKFYKYYGYMKDKN